MSTRLHPTSRGWPRLVVASLALGSVAVAGAALGAGRQDDAKQPPPGSRDTSVHVAPIPKQPAPGSRATSVHLAPIPKQPANLHPQPPTGRIAQPSVKPEKATGVRSGPDKGRAGGADKQGEPADR
jgi:hypothetical protein